MRKLILTALLALPGFLLSAQDLNDVQKDVKKGKYEDAKVKIDKMLTDPKNQGNPDAWFQKAKIYNQLIKDKNDTALLTDGYAAIRRYYKMEASKPEGKKLVQALLEGHETLFDLRQAFFNSGVKNWDAKNWEGAYRNFTNALDAFNFIAQQNIIEGGFDTISTIYAAYAAHNAQRMEDAVKHYTTIANAEVSDSNFVNIYEFLIAYHTQNENTEEAQKYLAVGKKLFPGRSKWLDFELQTLDGDRAEKLKKMEDLTVQYPDDGDLRLNFAMELYNYLYVNDTKPSDFSKRYQQMNEALDRAMANSSNRAFAYFIKAQSLNNDVYDLQLEYSRIKGTKAEDLQKKKEVSKKLDDMALEMAKVAQAGLELYEAVEEPTASDKANQRKLILQLIDFYEVKKDTAKVQQYEKKLKDLK